MQQDEPVQVEQDAQLIARCQSGDTAAFNDLITKYRSKVYSMIFNMVRNEQDAWDLSQEAFLKAWRNLDRFRGQSSFYTWLYRIATNVTIDWVRKKQIEGGVEFDDTIGMTDIEPGSSTTPQAEALPHQRMEQEEVQARIADAIEQLSPEHRTVILLREVDGLQYEEIAEAMHCSVGTVMSRLFYARKKLQTLLRDVYENI
jgi:RNA polymerase sigma-70 factor (ECF subfamily)